MPLRFFRSSAGVEPVREWLRALPRADRRAIGEDLKRLEYGWPVGMPLARRLAPGLFELRTPLPTRRSARVIVCFHEGELIALHAFVKKSRKTPKREIQIARERKGKLEERT